MEQYKLLRSNKQSGPYTADQLIEMGFKAYDLVWVENKSAAWRYPGEIEEFKKYAPMVEEQPFDRFYKKKESIAAKDASAVFVPPQPIVAKQEKPRIKIKADCRKIEPGKNLHLIAGQKTITTATASSSEPSWESAWLNWEEEKKQANVLSTLKKAPEKNNGFVYGEDISASSSDTALYDFSPKNPGFSYKTIISTGVIVLALVGAGIWFGIKWTPTESERLKVALIAEVENNPVINDAAVINTDAITEDTKNAHAQEVVNTKQDEYPAPASLQNSEKKPNPKNTALLHVKKDQPVSQQPNAAAKQNKPLIIQETIEKNNVPQQQITSVSAKAVPSQVNNENTIEKKRKPEPNISQYIQLHQQGQTPGVQYEIENTSNINIELVMIDLLYFDIRGKYLKGETMYVRNIGAGELAKIKSPVNTAAQKVTAKISMISSAEKDLYLIAE